MKDFMQVDLNSGISALSVKWTFYANRLMSQGMWKTYKAMSGQENDQSKQKTKKEDRIS
jgi:hypothetical protein